MFVEHVDLNKYRGDARSFGYHFDDGACTVITYKQVVGILADDTVELFDNCASIKKYMRKPHHSILEIADDDTLCHASNSELLIRYDNEYFYKDEKGYWFTNEYFCNGRAHRVTNDSAELYREVNMEYQRMVAQYNKLIREALDNMKRLQETI